MKKQLCGGEHGKEVFGMYDILRDLGVIAVVGAFLIGLFSAITTYAFMSILHPVRRATSFAFCPSLPIARES